MAADTAYLEGGPCNGRTKKISAAESDTGQIVCKGMVYKNLENGTLHHGDIVFKYAGSAANLDNPGVTPLNDTRAHKGWADLQHSFNVEWPKRLRSSEKVTSAALRSLARTRKVKR